MSKNNRVSSAQVIADYAEVIVSNFASREAMTELEAKQYAAYLLQLFHRDYIASAHAEQRASDTLLVILIIAASLTVLGAILAFYHAAVSL